MNGGSSRNGLLAAICLMAVLEVVLVLSARLGGELGERDVVVFNTAFASIGGICAVLLLVLRLESVKETAERVDRKADLAAVTSGKAAQAAATAAQKVAEVHHDFNNDVLIKKVLQAIKQAETDPEIVEQRIESVAKGVQQDRHATGSAVQKAYAQGVADALRRLQMEPDGPESAA